eukprot:7561067-Karenia_brevis.AAC.1
MTDDDADDDDDDDDDDGDDDNDDDVHDVRVIYGGDVVGNATSGSHYASIAQLQHLHKLQLVCFRYTRLIVV